MPRHIRIAVYLILLCAGLMARPWILLFGTAACDDCAEFKQNWQEEYTQPDDPLLIFINVEDEDNYRFLAEIEKTLHVTDRGSSFPILLVGRRFLKGTDGFDDVADDLPQLLEKLPDEPIFKPLQALADSSKASMVEYTAPKAEPVAATSQQTHSTQQTLHLLFFEQPGCQKCSRQRREFTLLQQTLPGLQISAYDVTTLEGQAMLSRARKALNINEKDKNLAPMVAWGDGYVTGRLATAEEIQSALAFAPQDAVFWLTPLTQDELNGEQDRLSGFLKTLTWSTIVLGGLLDGINPCAFATSIFLISYLLYLKRRRRDIIVVGACFCIGVFITYFLFGLALSSILRQIQNWRWLKIALYGGIGIAGIVLCVLHLRDAFRYRRTGKASDMDMGLSKDTHRSIHEKIRKFTTYRTWLMGPAAVVLGGMVSSMELACTGQVYFPALTAMSSQGFNARFVWMLTCYNLFFILPLAVITVLAAYGVGAKALGDWAKNHVFPTKIIMALLFALLGVLMIWLAFR
jgi:cytochrome c biogenesis protein CcdA